MDYSVDDDSVVGGVGHELLDCVARHDQALVDDAKLAVLDGLDAAVVLLARIDRGALESVLAIRVGCGDER